MGKELIIFNEFRELVYQESKPIEEFDLEKMEKVNKAKQTLELRLKILEQSRQTVLTTLGEQHQLPPEQRTLKNIAEFAPPEMRDKLLRVRNTFIRLTDELKIKVEDNSKLVHSSLRLIHGLQHLITRSLEEPVTYEEAGKKAPRKVKQVRSYEGGRV